MTRPNRHRLRAAADEALERLRHLDQQREDALDLCRPGPGPREIEAARQEWLTAEALACTAEEIADAAARMANKERTAT